MRTLQADVSLGVPGTTPKVRRLSDGGLRANSSSEGVSSVARKTGTIRGVPGLALIGNCSAYSESVEEGSGSAFFAGLSIPNSAKRVAAAVEGGRVDNAGSIAEDIAIEAGEAGSLFVPGVALI